MNQHNPRELLDKKERTLSTLDTALNAIKTAGCPMNDPEVTKITTPLQQLRSKIAGAKAAAAPAPSAPVPQAASPTATAPKPASATASSNAAPAKISTLVAKFFAGKQENHKSLNVPSPHSEKL